MRGLKILAAAAALACLSAPPARAHFQMIYTPQANLEKPGDIAILLLFAHPFENGPVMDMGQPRQFFVVAKGKKTDLLDKLKPVTFKGAENSAAAFETTFPIRALGDYIFVLDPAPFWEPTEHHFIHQIAKAYVNMGEAPTVWAAPVGLPTEIVPLNKPTAIIAGSTFSGQVLTRWQAGRQYRNRDRICRGRARSRHAHPQAADSHTAPRRHAGRPYRRQRRVHLRHSQGWLLGVFRDRFRPGEDVRGQGPGRRRGDLDSRQRFQMSGDLACI